MSNPYQNETFGNMNQTNPNQGPIFAQPVQVVAGSPTYPYQAQPNVVVVKETSQSSGRCCYCRGPKKSPCGCCSPNEEYCCIIVAFAYILMSLRYILTCLCILRMCRSLRRGGIC